MKIDIRRGEEIASFEVPLSDVTLLEVLNFVKKEQDSTLAYASDCRSSVCGSCAVRVNGKEQLACAYKPNDGDLVEPLRNAPVLRDLVVDMDKAYSFNKVANAWATPIETNVHVSKEDAHKNEVQSDCILCGSCYSACPVYTVNPEFIGPFALTRSWKYAADARGGDITHTIAAVQNRGIYDCTLCGECVPVCPQGIAPKQDIMMLKNKSGVMGYMDPSFAMGFGGGLSF